MVNTIVQNSRPKVNSEVCSLIKSRRKDPQADVLAAWEKLVDQKFMKLGHGKRGL